VVLLQALEAHTLKELTSSSPSSVVEAAHLCPSCTSCCCCCFYFCCWCCCCRADEGANPGHVAADLLSQAEHGPDSQVVLLALPGVDLDAVQHAVQKQCDELPRNETARKALSHSCVVQVRPGGVRCAGPCGLGWAGGSIYWDPVSTMLCYDVHTAVWL
jgi:hypothetical protein